MDEYSNTNSNEDVCDKLDEVSGDICGKLDNAISAIKANTEHRKGYAQTAIGVFLMWAVFYAVIPGIWHSKVRYAFQYGVNYSDVEKDKKPHDCEFVAAPLGAKYCEYEIDIMDRDTRLSRNTSGEPIVSYDAGKTWELNVGEYAVTTASHKVYVGWKKADE